MLARNKHTRVSASFSARTWILLEKCRLSSRRGKCVSPPALRLRTFSAISGVCRRRSWTRRDGPTQSNADHRVRETVRERTPCQPRSHESPAVTGPAVRSAVKLRRPVIGKTHLSWKRPVFYRDESWSSSFNVTDRLSCRKIHELSSQGTSRIAGVTACHRKRGRNQLLSRALRK